MIFSKYRKELFIFIILISIIFILLDLIVKKYNNYRIYSSDMYTSIIRFNDDINDIYVEYPRFKSDKLNNIVTNIIYNYVKSFKKNNYKKRLYISYDTYNINEYLNIQFYIEDSINNNHYKNILLNLDKDELSYIEEVCDINSLKNIIYKYFDDSIKSINNYVYIFKNNRLYIYNKMDVIGINMDEVMTKK